VVVVVLRLLVLVALGGGISLLSRLVADRADEDPPSRNSGRPTRAD
jgi:hypothetical protein